MTDGCKNIYFIEFFNKIHIFSENFPEMVSKMPYSCKKSQEIVSLQPSVTVAKGKISFATMTLGYKGYFSLFNHD